MLEPQSEHVLQHRTGDTLTYPNSSGGSLKLQRRLPKTIGASRKRRFTHQRPLLRAAEAALHALDSLRRSSDRSSLPSAVLQAIFALRFEHCALLAVSPLFREYLRLRRCHRQRQPAVAARAMLLEGLSRRFCRSTRGLALQTEPYCLPLVPMTKTRNSTNSSGQRNNTL